jgi:hypothetical protein
MTSINLKEQLISQIQITEDIDILEWMLQLLMEESTGKGEYVLNAEQIIGIQRAEAQIISGDYYTEEEADKLTEEWLKK